MQLDVFYELRPCEVDGKKALFHRWEDKVDPILKIDSDNVHDANQLREIVKHFEHNITIAPYSECDVNIRAQALAIVEYEDGTVDEVEPIRVKFLDSAAEFSKYCWR